MSHQCFVIVSDAGESWALNGDDGHEDKDNKIMPKLLADGWKAIDMKAGSGAKDDTSYWMVLLEKH